MHGKSALVFRRRFRVVPIVARQAVCVCDQKIFSAMLQFVGMSQRACSISDRTSGAIRWQQFLFVVLPRFVQDFAFCIFIDYV